MLSDLVLELVSEGAIRGALKGSSWVPAAHAEAQQVWGGCKMCGEVMPVIVCNGNERGYEKRDGLVPPPFLTFSSFASCAWACIGCRQGLLSTEWVGGVRRCPSPRHPQRQGLPDLRYAHLCTTTTVGVMSCTYVWGGERGQQSGQRRELAR